MTGERASVDLVVVGAGVFGLSVARRALAAGLTVTVLEARRLGAGASGGLLGVLAAHGPERWSAKKQYQLDALLEWPDWAAGLEAETGRAAGYVRCGRLTPARTEAFRVQAAARSAAAAERWPVGQDGIGYALKAGSGPPGWMAADVAAHVADGLAARVRPADTLAALAAAVRLQGGAILEGRRYLGWIGGAAAHAPAQGGAAARLPAGAVVLSAGWEGFAAIEAALAAEGAGRLSLGGGLKGQAALLELPEAIARDSGFDAHWPILTEGGVYAAPVGPREVVAAGVDSAEWTDPSAPDLAFEPVLARVRALAPILAAATPRAQWAGVRPRPWARDPLLGRLPGPAPLFAATGGYKIGFGIAHRIADSVLDALTGRAPLAPPPESFGIESHCAEAAARARRGKI